MDTRPITEDNNDYDVSAKLAESTDIVVMKLQGMFYNAYSDSAKVLHEVTGFKLNQKSPTSQPKCGFPSGSVHKVAELLKEANVSFVVLNKGAVAFHFGATKNRFYEVLNGFDDSDLVRVWMKDEAPVMPNKTMDMKNQNEEKIEKKEKRTFLSFLKERKKIFLVLFLFFVSAGIIILTVFAFSGNDSNSVAKSSQESVFAAYDTSDIVLCDYTVIPVSVDLPSTVSDDDLSVYMDKVLSDFGSDMTSETVTDDFCVENLGVSSVDEFRSALKADLYSYKNEYISGYIDGAVQFYLTEKSKINIPDEQYEDFFEDRVQQQIDLFISQYCDGNEDNYEAKTKELTVYESTDDLEDFLRETIKESFDLHLIYMAIAEKEDITASGEEYETWVNSAASNQGFSDLKDFYSFYDTEFESGEEYIKEQFIYEKVASMVSGNASVIYNEDVNVTDVMLAGE